MGPFTMPAKRWEIADTLTLDGAVYVIVTCGADARWFTRLPKPMDAHSTANLFGPLVTDDIPHEGIAAAAIAAYQHHTAQC